MNKQEIEKAIDILMDDREWQEGEGYEAYNLAISALRQQLTNGWIPENNGYAPNSVQEWEQTELPPIEEDIIQSQEKELCYKQVKCRYNETGCGDCKYTHGLNKQLTIGDKIRESNESLADAIDGFRACNRCLINGNNCFPNYNTLDYLNQPYKE